MSYFEREESLKWSFAEALRSVMDEKEINDIQSGLDVFHNIIKDREEEIVKKWIKDWKKHYQTEMQKTGTSSKSANKTVFNIKSNQNINVSCNVTNRSAPKQRLGKRKLTEVNAGPSSQDLTPTADEQDNLDDLFHAAEPPTQSPSPSAFRNLVFKAAYNLFKSNSSLEAIAELNRMAASLTPTSLGQCLDHLSHQLINSELRNEEELALKLSLSHIIYLVGGATMPVADAFFSNQTEPIKATYQNLKNSKPSLPKGLSDAMSKMFDEVLVALAVSKKNARVHTLLKRAECLQSDQGDPEVIQLLDILDYVISSDFTKEKKSELSYYRPLAYILDILFRDCELGIEDGELASEATKEVRNQNRLLCNDDDQKKVLCGRKIDLLVSSMSTNLSSSEWKKATTTNSLAQAQQIKNSRTNSAVLHNLAKKLPISGNGKNKLFTLGMDWIGSVGYLFSVANVDDVHVVFHHGDLFFPEALSEMADFKQTIDLLYSFKRHLLDLKTMIEAGHHRQLREQKLKLYRSAESTTASPGPQTFFTPTKRK